MSIMAPSMIVESAPPVLDTQAATILTSPLSINGVASRRKQATKISGALAPFASSDMFKGAGDGKPRARRWDHILSQESRSREASSLKATARYLGQPGLISLGGGLPGSQYFPFESMAVKVPVPPNFSEEETRQVGQVLHAGKHDYTEGKSLYDINIAFNYGQATGSPQLLRFVTEHTEIVHNPPYRDWNCCLTGGSTHALELAIRMFCDRGDCILSEEYTFASAVETCLPLGVQVIGVGMDDEGILPDALDKVLCNWDTAERGMPKPYVLYAVPTGQNPTGATQGIQRRKDVYAICQKHDVYIVEDDPYYCLQMLKYNSDPNATPPPRPGSHEEFLQSLVPSFLALDVDGRVMRLDSFSKIIAPGSRVGWITASEQIVDRYVKHCEVSTQNPAGISQLVLYKLLEEAWGHGGFLSWLQHIQCEYSRRRDTIVRACEEHLPTEVASWRPPTAGMFHWVAVDWTKHPKVAKLIASKESSQPTTADDKQMMLQIEEDVFQAGVARGVLFAKGSFFRAEKDGGSSLFFRTTFAAAPEDAIREAIKRFGDTLRAEFDIPSAT